MDNFSQYIGKKLILSSVKSWKDSDVQQLYKRNPDSFVWRIRDNNQEKDNFVFLIIRHKECIISEIEIELISIYGTGDSESICKNLTKNELKQVFDIILACIDV